MIKIPLSRPNISDAAIERVSAVLRSGKLVHGIYGREFEAAIASYLGCSEAIVVSSGTAALHLALMALDIGPGDAVVVPDFTFPATANAVRMTGARVLLADVSEGTYTLSLDAARKVIDNFKGPETIRAIMPVHEFGTPAAMDEILALAEDRRLDVIEDAACALGAQYKGKFIGSRGKICCFSFHPRKTLTTGEGGAVTTNDPVLAKRIRRLRNHGIEVDSGDMRFVESSTNYRLTDFQSILGLTQLAELDKWLMARRDLAALYRHRLSVAAADLGLSLPAYIDGQSWQTYMIVLPPDVNRAVIIQRLKEQGIETNLGAQCLSVIGLYGQAEKIKPYSVAERLYKHGLALPLYEMLTEQDIDLICTNLVKTISDVRMARC